MAESRRRGRSAPAAEANASTLDASTITTCPTQDLTRVRQNGSPRPPIFDAVALARRRAQGCAASVPASAYYDNRSRQVHFLGTGPSGTKRASNRARPIRRPGTRPASPPRRRRPDFEQQFQELPTCPRQRLGDARLGTRTAPSLRAVRTAKTARIFSAVGAHQFPAYFPWIVRSFIRFSPAGLVHTGWRPRSSSRGSVVATTAPDTFPVLGY